MNERIKELIEQATMIKEVGCEGYLGRSYTRQEKYFDKEKFAELIVEECRNVVSEVYRNTPLELCGPLLTTDEAIAKHFYGVEK